MKRIFMSILAVGTAVALSAGPVFAGGETLSDGDLDQITASSYYRDRTSPDTLVGGSGGGVQNNDSSQQGLEALNNVNASQSNVANQTNVLFLRKSSFISIVIQRNEADFDWANNGDNSGEATLGMGYGYHRRGYKQKDDDVMLGGAGGGVQNNDESQQFLMAVNNVNASQSNVANQTNIVASKPSRHHHSHGSLFSLIVQRNTADFKGNNGSNKTKNTYIKDPKNKDDLLVANSGGGVQNNNKSQQELTALNNVNASQSNVANQTNIAIAGKSFIGIALQSNSASFSGQNGGNSTGRHYHHYPR